MRNFKILKVKKTYRNGSHEGHIIVDVYDEKLEDEIFENHALDWAEADSSGAIYGWKVYWEEEKDEIIKQSIIQQKINIIGKEMDRLQDYAKKLTELLNSL